MLLKVQLLVLDSKLAQLKLVKTVVLEECDKEGIPVFTELFAVLVLPAILVVLIV